MMYEMVEQTNRMEELYEKILKTNRKLVREVKKSTTGSTKEVDESLKREKLELEKLKEDRRQRDINLKQWKTAINAFKTVFKE